MADFNLYTLQEVADILKCSMQTVYRYVRAGRIKAVKYGKAYRVNEEDLHQFITTGYCK